VVAAVVPAAAAVVVVEVAATASLERADDATRAPPMACAHRSRV
jgi:hypothetical protein